MGEIEREGGYLWGGGGENEKIVEESASMSGV